MAPRTPSDVLPGLGLGAHPPPGTQRVWPALSSGSRIVLRYSACAPSPCLDDKHRASCLCPISPVVTPKAGAQAHSTSDRNLALASGSFPSRGPALPPTLSFT